MSSESICKGLKLELKPLKTEYRTGELPEFNAIISNISFEEIILCTYMLRHRLMSGLFAGTYRVYHFGSNIALPLSKDDFAVIKPDENLTINLNFDFDGDYHFLNTSHLPKIVDKSMVLGTFPQGAHTFNAYLGPNVIYTLAPPDTYAHEKEVKKVLEEVDREENFDIDLSTVWDGELHASAQVRFL